MYSHLCVVLCPLLCVALLCFLYLVRSLFCSLSEEISCPHFLGVKKKRLKDLGLIIIAKGAPFRWSVMRLNIITIKMSIALQIFVQLTSYIFWYVSLQQNRPLSLSVETERVEGDACYRWNFLCQCTSCFFKFIVVNVEYVKYLY